MKQNKKPEFIIYIYVEVQSTEKLLCTTEKILLPEINAGGSKVALQNPKNRKL